MAVERGGILGSSGARLSPSSPNRVAAGSYNIFSVIFVKSNIAKPRNTDA